MTGIRNFVQMTEAVGTSRQPTAAQFDEIAQAGYSAVVNLAMPDSDDALADEGSLVTALGMKYIHIPVPFDAPTKEHLRSFIRVMRAIDAYKVWVHCVVNARVFGLHVSLASAAAFRPRLMSIDAISSNPITKNPPVINMPSRWLFPVRYTTAP